MNFNNMMKQAQDLQKKMAEAQKKVESLEAEGTSGGGLIKIIIDGKNNVKSVKIDDSLISKEDVEILEDLILAAFNDANISENFTDLIVMKDGRKISGDRFKPELFTDVTAWRIRLKCPSSAVLAARILGHLTVSSTIIDEDYLLCDLAIHRGPI